MAATRKLQIEIERTLKKVQQALDEFRSTWEKMDNASEVPPAHTRNGEPCRILPMVMLFDVSLYAELEERKVRGRIEEGNQTTAEVQNVFFSFGGMYEGKFTCCSTSMYTDVSCKGARASVMFVGFMENVLEPGRAILITLARIAPLHAN